MTIEQVKNNISQLIADGGTFWTAFQVAGQILSITEILIKDPDQSLPEEYNLHGSIVADKMLKEHWVKVKEKSNEKTE